MSAALFGYLPDGQPVHRITLSGHGLTATILDYGAIVQDLRLQGHQPALVLGFHQLDDYLQHSPYFGAIAGRCANRIRDGLVQLDGQRFELDRNFLGKHCLHGGSVGMGKRLWRLDDTTTTAVTLTISLADGDMGFPGNLTARVTYQLMPGGTLDIVMEATTDQLTLCNLAHHSYFNLDGSSSILDHRLQVLAQHYNPVDGELIPTGEIRPVADTQMDLRQQQALVETGDEGRTAGRRLLDHNFCLSRQRAALRHVATLASPLSGVSMRLHTTEPGLQIYTGGKINCPVPGLDGMVMGANSGIAMEPQTWPDGIHQPQFPQATLQPGEQYLQHTQYIFDKEQP